jgi:hypothetical protein
MLRKAVLGESEKCRLSLKVKGVMGHQQAVEKHPFDSWLNGEGLLTPHNVSVCLRHDPVPYDLNRIQATLPKL